LKKQHWKDFEKLAESIFKLLNKDPKYTEVIHDVKVQGKHGKRQVDVLVKHENCGFQSITAIECKHYKGNVSIGVIDKFHSSLLDINANKGILITNKGFSSQAIAKAKHYGISLCIAEEVTKERLDNFIDVPVLIESYELLKFQISCKVHARDNYHVEKSNLINIGEHNVVDLINKNWKKHKFEVQGYSGTQDFELNELEFPYTHKDELGAVYHIADYRIKAKIRVKHYRTSTSKLLGTKVLQNITEKKRFIFFDIATLKKLDTTLFEISKSRLKNQTEFPVKIRMTTNPSFSEENLEFSQTPL